MHRITRSCVLFLWIHTLTFVKSQECTLQSFLNSPLYDENFDTSIMEDTYAVGKQVTVPCVVGYIGFFKLICVEGNWQSRGTRCQPVKCTVPDIQNGYVPGGSQAQRVYNEHEILHFACDPLYKRAEDRPSACTKIGQKAEFSPTPTCEQIKCKLDQLTPTGTTYEPAYRNLFLPGDKLTVRCGDKYYFFHFWEMAAEVTCQENGQWSATPVCREVICEKRHPHVIWPREWRQIKLQQSTSYTCGYGYKTTSVNNEATCTRDGWTPNPLCEEITCNSMRVDDADIVGNKQVYRYSEKAVYRCKEGYTGNPTRTCRENGWIGSSQCTAISGNCRPPPEVENAVAVTSHQEEYLPGSQVTYQCHDNYTMEGENTLQCNNGKWEKNFVCTRGCEAPPVLEDGEIKNTMKSQYSHNETVEYQCQAYYTMEGEPYRTCISGKWTGHMRCLKPCIANEDNFRQHNITLKSHDKKFFKHDEMMEFRCARGIPVGAVAMHQRCNSGVVHLPTCQ